METLGYLEVLGLKVQPALQVHKARREK